MRIVSLFSSASYVLRGLGLSEQVAGVSYCCPIPGKEIVVRPTRDLSGLSSQAIDRAVQEMSAARTPMYSIDEEKIASIKPDLILAQSLCDVCAVSGDDARRLVERLNPRPRLLTLHPHTLEDILRDIEAVGEAAGVAARARALVANLQQRLQAIQQAVAGLPRRKVVLLEWVSPPMSCGHWVPEMAAAAGAEELIGRRGEGARRISLDDVRRADPDFLFLIPCGLSVEETVREAKAFADPPANQTLRAVRENRLYALDPILFSEHGPEVFDGIELLAALCHPERLPADPRLYRRVELNKVGSQNAR